jgi:phage head maturation protease
MPIPKPRSDEDQDEFIGRCMSDETMQSEYPDQEQRAAVCFSQWRGKTAGRMAFKVTCIEPKAVDEDERSIKSVITTDSLDRDCEVVLTKGLNFKDLKNSGAVLFMHDPSKVVGRNAWVQKEKAGAAGMQAIAKTIFAKTELAEEVFQLIKGGFIKGWSIGMDWMSQKRRDLTEKDLKSRPDWAGASAVIEKASVLEYSAVSIPANAEAVTLAYERGLVKATKSYMPLPKRHVSVSVPRTVGMCVVRPTVEPVRVSDVRL